MHCPRCHTAELTERTRSGIQIDVCNSCRGVWLDRGELDKLIAHEARANDEDDDDDLDDDDDDRPTRTRQDGRSEPEPRRRWWEIFD